MYYYLMLWSVWAIVTEYQDQVALKTEIYFSHSGGRELRDQGASMVRIWCSLTSWSAEHTFLLCPQKVENTKRSLFFSCFCKCINPTKRI